MASIGKTLAVNFSNDWEIEEKTKKEIIFAASMVALTVLVAFGAIYHEAVFSFLKTHLEFSTIILPSVVTGLVFAIALDKMEEGKRKKLTVLAITICLALVASWAALSGFRDVKLASLSLGGGLLLYFTFNSKKPFPAFVKDGDELIDPTTKFSYGNIVTPDFEEVCVELYLTNTVDPGYKVDPGAIIPVKRKLGVKEGCLPECGSSEASDKNKEYDYYLVQKGQPGVYECGLIHQVKTKETLPKKNEIVAFEGQYGTCYGRVEHVDPANQQFFVIEQRKRVFSRSQKKVLENGHTLYPLYIKDVVGEKRNMASYAWLGMAAKSGVAASVDIGLVPFHIPYLIFRSFYDFYKSEDRWELLGNRFFEIISVPGEAIKSAVTNVLCAVGAIFGCFAMFIEGLFRARPMVSQKFLAKLEQVQNQVPLYKSYWLFPKRGSQFHFNPKADLDMTPNQEIHLKNYGVYILGCCQPHDALELDQDGKIVKISNLQNPKLQYEVVSKESRPLDLSSQEGWTTASIKKFKGKQ